MRESGSCGSKKCTCTLWTSLINWPEPVLLGSSDQTNAKLPIKDPTLLHHPVTHSNSEKFTAGEHILYVIVKTAQCLTSALIMWIPARPDIKYVQLQRVNYLIFGTSLFQVKFTYS